MRIHAAVAVLGTLVLVPAVQATDKTASSMVNIGAASGVAPAALAGPISTAFTNGVSKGTNKGSSKCKVQIQLKSLTGIPDSDAIPGNGDEVICLSDSNVTLPGPVALGANGAVLRGNVKGGKMKIKVDLAAEGTGCGQSGVTQYDGRTSCYAPDPAYTPCGGGGTIVFASDPSQCVVLGTFPARPASGLIATQGLFFP